MYTNCEIFIIINSNKTFYSGEHIPERAWNLKAAGPLAPPQSTGPPLASLEWAAVSATTTESIVSHRNDEDDEDDGCIQWVTNYIANMGGNCQLAAANDRKVGGGFDQGVHLQGFIKTRLFTQFERQP